VQWKRLSQFRFYLEAVLFLPKLRGYKTFLPYSSAQQRMSAYLRGEKSDKSPEPVFCRHQTSEGRSQLE
jgi:hypothetical protein